MHSTRWFGSVMMEASYPSEPIMLEELERVLDTARPSRVDPVASEAYDGSFVIAHTKNFLGNIEIEVWEDWADLSSIVTKRQIKAADFGDQWIHETARTVDQIIRGTYDIVRTHWHNKIISTEVVTGGSTHRERSTWDHLPIPQRSLTHERFHLDYGCSDGADSNRPDGAN